MLTAILMVGMTVACGGPENAESTGPLAQPPITPTGPDVRIGTLDDPAYAFRAVRLLREGPNGLLYSMHNGEAMLRRWTADGAPSGQIGREGEGPGEFRRPSNYGFFGDSLWVFDLSGFRVIYLDLEGNLLGTSTARVERSGENRSPVGPTRPFRDGTYLARGVANPRLVASGEMTETEVLWVDGTGEELARLDPIPHRPTDIVPLANPAGGVPFAPQLVTDAPLLEAEESAVVRVDRLSWDGTGEAEAVVRRQAPSGDTIALFRLAYDPIALDEDLFEELVDERVGGMWEMMQQFRPDLTRESFERQYREALYRPDFLPPVESLVVAGDGSTWLLATDGGGSPPTWWVLGPDMSPLGRVETPEGFDLKAVHEDRLWGVEMDELGVNYIVRYRYQPFTR